MTLAERLRHALDAPAPEVVLLVGDERDAAFADPRPAVDAAVLVPVTDRPEPGVILTRRTETLKRHAGQVAFPGGRVDPNDADVVAAALREAEEEIGLPPKRVTVIGPTARTANVVTVRQPITSHDFSAALTARASAAAGPRARRPTRPGSRCPEGPARRGQPR